MLSKDLSQTKKKEEEGNEEKEIRGMKQTLTPFNVVFGFDETQNRNRSVLNGCRSVLGLFWVKFQSAFGLELVLRNFCIKEILGF